MPTSKNYSTDLPYIPTPNARKIHELYDKPNRTKQSEGKLLVVFRDREQDVLNQRNSSNHTDRNSQERCAVPSCEDL